MVVCFDCKNTKLSVYCSMISDKKCSFFPKNEKLTLFEAKMNTQNKEKSVTFATR